MADQIEGAPLVPERVAPAAGSRCSSVAITAERDRSGTGDDDDSRLTGKSACKRNIGVMCENISRGLNQTTRLRLVTLRAAA
jgi:hypothetical protein